MNDKIIKEFEQEFSNGTENAIGQKIFSPEFGCFSGEFFLKVERFIDKISTRQKQEFKRAIRKVVEEEYGEGKEVGDRIINHLENLSLKTLTSKTKEGWEEEFIEKGADLEHQRWANWQKYLHSVCIKNDNGDLTIPADSVEHWQQQIETFYSKLSEREKESDRKETRNYLPLIKSLLKKERQKVLEGARKIVQLKQK